MPLPRYTQQCTYPGYPQVPRVHHGTLGRYTCTAGSLCEPAVHRGNAWGSVPQEPAGRGGSGRQGRPLWRAATSRHGPGTGPWLGSREGVWIALGSNSRRTGLWPVRPGSQDPGIPDPRIP